MRFRSSAVVLVLSTSSSLVNGAILPKINILARQNAALTAATTLNNAVAFISCSISYSTFAAVAIIPNGQRSFPVLTTCVTLGVPLPPQLLALQTVPSTTSSSSNSSSSLRQSTTSSSTAPSSSSTPLRVGATFGSTGPSIGSSNGCSTGTLTCNPITGEATSCIKNYGFAYTLNLPGRTPTPNRCVACDAGTYSLSSNSALCTACFAGPSGPCGNCPFANDGSQLDAACDHEGSPTHCSPGYGVYNYQCTKCTAGIEFSQNNVCKACPRDTNFTSCDAQGVTNGCIVNYGVGPNSSENQPFCTACNPGFHSISGTATCLRPSSFYILVVSYGNPVGYLSKSYQSSIGAGGTEGVNPFFEFGKIENALEVLAPRSFASADMPVTLRGKSSPLNNKYFNLGFSESTQDNSFPDQSSSGIFTASTDGETSQRFDLPCDASDKFPDFFRPCQTNIFSIGPYGPYDGYQIQPPVIIDANGNQENVRFLHTTGYNTQLYAGNGKYGYGYEVKFFLVPIPPPTVPDHGPCNSNCCSWEDC